MLEPQEQLNSCADWLTQLININTGGWVYLSLKLCKILADEDDKNDSVLFKFFSNSSENNGDRLALSV